MDASVAEKPIIYPAIDPTKHHTQDAEKMGSTNDPKQCDNKQQFKYSYLSMMTTLSVAQETTPPRPRRQIHDK